MPRSFFPALAAALALSPLFPALPLGAQTILNTERFQLAQVEGPHLTLNLSATGRRGNTELFVADASGIVGLQRERHWTRVIFGGSYLRSDDTSILNNRFVQLRYSWIPNEQVQTFHFVQLQRNDNLRLRSRRLVGSGAQARVASGERRSLSLGTGAMVEWEELDADAVAPGINPETRALRMANLAVYRHELASGATILNILFFQPRFDDLGDLRVLNDLGITFPVTEQVRLTLTGEWRRDTRPPEALGRDDLILRAGVSLDFR